MPFSVVEHQTADLESTLTPARTTVKTASFTLALEDANRVIEMNSSSATTVTVPPDSTANFPIGTIIAVYGHGTGSVSIAQGSGVTMRSSISQTGTRSLRGQYAEGSLRKRATNDWVLLGDLT